MSSSRRRQTAKTKTLAFYRSLFLILTILAGQLFFVITPAKADPYPPEWQGGAGPAVHFDPVSWPNEPADPKECGFDCGDWIYYSRYNDSINDARDHDPSNGGTAPQNYVNIASSCIDTNWPSIYYHIDQANGVLMFRWRVEQIANTYATGPKAGAYSSSDPWNSALWTVFFDLDGDGYLDIAAHLDGSSGSPSMSIDRLVGIWSDVPNSQSLDYYEDPNIYDLAHNPTGFVDESTDKILNFHTALSPDINWPNGSNETFWDYGTSRSIQVTKQNVDGATCDEYFVDYQIPLGLLDASAVGGPKVDQNTAFSMFFCTANSLNNPFQKDCAYQGDWIGDPNEEAPFGDPVSFDDGTINQPIVDSIQADGCGQTKLTASIRDTLVFESEPIPHTSVSDVDFYYYYDANADGVANDGETWKLAASDAISTGLKTWEATWDSTDLLQGQYLLGVQAVDTASLNEPDESDGIRRANRTYSYLSQAEVDALPGNDPVATGEHWFANPEVTGAVSVIANLNVCGTPPPFITKSVTPDTVTAGDTVTFTLSISNTYDTPLTVNVITDTLPDGFSYIQTIGSDPSATTTPTGGATGEITWTLSSSIAATSTGVLTFTAQATTIAGTYANLASADTDDGLKQAEPVQISVGSPRLTLQKSANTFSAEPGDTVTYTISYANDSPVNVTNAIITDVLPTGMNYVSVLDGGSYNSGSRTLTWNVGALASGEGPLSARFVVTIENPYPDAAALPLVNTAYINADQTDQTMAKSSIHVNVPRPALRIQKDAPVLVSPGAQVPFTLTYVNSGNYTATNVIITDTVPVSLTYITANPLPTSTAGGEIVWDNIADIPAGGTGVITLTLEVDSSYPDYLDNPTTNLATMEANGVSPISDTFDVGILQSGQVCNTYYFHDETTDVGADSPPNRRIADTTVPLPSDTGTNITVTAPAGSFVEAVRFYQDPATEGEVDFAGNITTTIYIDRSNGPGLTIRGEVYDYDSDTGATTLLGTHDESFGGGERGAFTFQVNTSGTLQKNHRLRWIFYAMSEHPSTSFDVLFQLDGNVNNTISTDPSYFADSNAAFCITPPAKLVIDKQVNDLIAGPGDTLTYTIKFANIGQTNATGAMITDTLPTGTTFVTSTLNGSPVAPTTSSPPVYGFTINSSDVVTSGQVTGGETGELEITVLVDLPLDSSVITLANDASIESDQTIAITDTMVTTILRPELTISKSANDTLLTAGDTVTYTLIVINSDIGTASNVTISDTLPTTAYYTYVPDSTRVDGVVESPDPISGNLLRVNVGSMSSGQIVQVTFQMEVTSTLAAVPNGVTELGNTGAVSSTQTGEIDSSEIITVSVSKNANLYITKSFTPSGTRTPGDILTYTLTVENIGGLEAVNVRVVDPIPNYTTYIAGTIAYSGTAQTDADDTDNGEYDVDNGRVIFDVGALPATESRTMTFTMQIDDTMPNGVTPIENAATASAGNTAAKTGEVSTDVSAAPDLVVNKIGNDTHASPAATLTADASSDTTLSINDISQLVVGQYVRIGAQDVQITAIGNLTITVDSAITASSGDDVIGSFTYNVSYINQGDAAASSVIVTDTLPGSTDFITATTPHVRSGDTITWTVGDLDPGAGGVVKVIVFPTATGSLVNTAQLDSDETSMEEDTATTVVGGLRVSKHTTTQVVTQTLTGTSATYVIKVENTLPAAANDIVVTDTLASGFTYSETVSITGGTAPITNPTSGDAQPVWEVSAIAGNTTLAITFTVYISETVGPATYQNEVEVASSNTSVTPFDPLLTPDEDVEVRVPVVRLSKTVTPTSVQAGENVTYTITAENIGDATAQDVVITDTLPAGFSFDGTVSTDQDTAVRTSVYTATTPAWGIWDIAPSGRVTITFQAQTSAVTGTFTNTVSASTSNTLIPTKDELAPVTTTVPTDADLSITKNESHDPVNAGTNLTYTLTILNDGPAEATGIVVTDTLPAGVTFVSAMPDRNIGPNPLVWNSLTDLSSGNSTVITVVVTVNTATTGDIENVATVTADEPDPTPGNDTVTATTTITPQADLELDLDVNDITPNVNDVVTFTIIVTNTGPSNGTGITVSVPIPTGYTYGGDDSGGNYDDGTGLWTIGSLNDGSFITLVITATVNPSGDYDVYAQVEASDQYDDDSTPGDNSIGDDDDDTVNITPSAVVDLSLSKESQPNPAIPGDPITYTIVVTNAGPSAITAITLTDDLPTAVQGPVYTESEGSYDEGTGAWTSLTFGAGDTITLTIVGTLDAAFTGTLQNTAIVTPTGASDPDPGNNTGTDTNSLSTGTVTGVVYLDVNGDGDYDLGVDTPLSGVDVTIIDSNGAPSIVTTGINGVYTQTVLAGLTTVDVDDTDLPPGATLTVGSTDPTTVTVPSGGSGNVDVGYIQLGTVTGVIYLDEDDSGTYTPGDTPLPGVNVVITDVFGTVYTVTTGVAGTYTLTLPAGNATVDVDDSTLPPGAVLDSGSTDPTTVVVPPDDTVTDDTGYVLPPGNGTVTGVVYLDEDGDGAYTPGSDTPLAGVQVVITDTNGMTYTVTTGGDGAYTQTVPAGATVVDVNDATLPPGAVLDSGSSDPTTVIATAGNTVADDTGYVLLGTLTGVVYLDEDGDGTYTPGTDTPLPGIDVTVTDADGVTHTLTTDAGGAYTITLPAGDTTVDVDDADLPPGSVLDSGSSDPTTVVVPPGDSAASNTGYVQIGTVTGIVYLDEDDDGAYTPGVDTPLVGVAVTITDTFGNVYVVTTDATGAYTQTVPAGDTTVDVDDDDLLPGLVLDSGSTDPTTVTVPAAGSIADDTGYVPPPGTGIISGTIYLDENGNGDYDPGIDTPLPGVALVITDTNSTTYTVTTDADGQFSLVVPDGSTTADVDDTTLPTGAVLDTGSTDPTTVNVPDGGTALDDTGYVIPAGTGIVEGTIYLDDDGDGVYTPGTDTPLSGVAVIITDTNGLTYTVTTDANGYYSETLPTGSATVDVDDTTLPPGATLDSGSTDPTTVIVPLDDTVLDDTGYVQIGTVTGVVYLDEDGDGTYTPGTDTPLAGVNVVITDTNGMTYTVTTGADGAYTLTLPAGDATVDVDDSTLPPGAVLDSGSTDPTSVVVPGGDTVTANTGYILVGDLTGIVYLDEDGDGVYTPGTDTPLAGVDVVITDSGGNTYTVTTGVNGAYTQTVLAGAATVDVDDDDLPPGVTLTIGNSDPTTVVVPPGDTVVGDTGYVWPPGTGTVSGTIYLDENGDGAYTFGVDTPLPGVQVVITDANGVTYTLTTGADGTYSQTVPAGPTIVDVNDATLPGGAILDSGSTDPTTVIVTANDSSTVNVGYIVPERAIETTKRDTLVADADLNGYPSPGDTLSYTIVISNEGSLPLTGVTLNDMPDSNTTLVVGSVSTSQGTVVTGNTGGDTNVAVDVGDIPPGASVTVSFQITINDPLPDGVTQVSNTGLVSSNELPTEPTDDPDTPPDDDETTTPVTADPLLDAAKTDALFDDADGNSMPSPGDTIEYQIAIINYGNGVATGVVFDDIPDPNTTLVTGSVQTSQGTVTVGNTPGDTYVSIDVGTVISDGGTVNVTFQVLVNDPLPPGVTQVANAGTVSSDDEPVEPTDDPDTPPDDDETIMPLTTDPLIEALKTDTLFVDADGDGVPSPGDTLLYQITILNSGNGAATNVVFDDTLDPNTTLVNGTVQTSLGLVTSGNIPGDTHVAVNVGTLLSGASVDISFQVTIDDPLPAGVTTVANQGQVSSEELPVEPTDDPETPPDDDETVTPVTAAPALEAEKSGTLFVDADGDGVPSPGDTLLYQVAIVNSGNGVATGITFDDMPDSNTILLTGTVQTSLGTVTGGNGAGDTSVSVDIGALPAGAQVDISYQVQVNDPLPGYVTHVVNQGLVSSNELPVEPTDDPDTPPDDDETEIPVSTVPVLEAQKSDALFVDADDDGTPSPGDTLLYQVTIINSGNTEATNVRFDDTPDPNTDLVIGSVQTSQGTVTNGNNPGDTSVSVKVGTIPGGGSEVNISFRVVITNPLPLGVTQISNQGVISSTELPPEPTDDPDTPTDDDETETIIVAAPEIEIYKTDFLFEDIEGDGWASPGDTLLYEVGIVNNGTAVATGIVFSDTVDPNTTLVTGSVQTSAGTVITGNNAGDSYVVVNVNYIPGGGGTVHVSFQVTVNDPLPEDAREVLNQGLISGDNFDPEPTDDPDTPEDDDETETPVILCPMEADIYEPDNLYPQAMEIPTDGTVQTRTLHMVADKDWVRFYAEAGAIYTITTSHLPSDVDTVLQLYDTDGVILLEENDDYMPGSKASRIVWTAPVEGWYYARVTHFDHTWDPRYSLVCGNYYLLSVEKTSSCPTGADIYEPNNLYPQAIEIPTDGTVQTHTLHTVADKDWIQFFAVENKTYTITTSHLPADVDTVLQLYDTDGETMLEENDDYMLHSDASRIVWTAHATGWYYVRITHFDHTYDPRYSLVCGNTYQVAVETTACAISADAYEPDNLYPQAIRTLVDGTALTRTFHTVADKDWVSFHALAGKVYTITTSQLSGDVDTVLQLYGTDGVTLLEENDDYQPNSKASRIVWRAPADGRYFVRTTHFDHTYDPRVSPICGSQYLIAVETAACITPPDAYEMDNFYSEAVEIPTDGTVQTHTLHTAADKDWLTFYAWGGQVYSITTFQLSPDVDTVLRMYDADGVTLLAENDDYLTNSDASGISWKAPADGWYFVRITHFDSSYNPQLSPFCGNRYYVSIKQQILIANKAAEFEGPAPEEGDEILYTIVVTNLMQTDQTNIIITDTIPNHTTYVTGSAWLTKDGIASQDSIYGPDPLVVKVGTLQSHHTATLTFRVTVDMGNLGQRITNIAIINSDQQGTPILTPYTTVSVLHHLYLPVVLKNPE
ncbi:MAG: pre-peptidase C-terminal domain-containing protein [Chloroflexota bacterium]|nr:pre-peptidase C-terminal domain-containing protein [Chloroflexota bacterium]